MIRFLMLLLSTEACLADSLVPTRMIRAHELIAAQDIEISATAMPGAIPSDSNVVGLEAKVTLYPGRPILPAQIGPAALVERNQPVKLVFQQGGLFIETEARALSRGALGDIIRVMNLGSRTTVSGRVMADGRVNVSSAGTSR